MVFHLTLPRGAARRPGALANSTKSRRKLAPKLRVYRLAMSGGGELRAVPSMKSTW
jgi:hypothetical protein